MANADAAVRSGALNRLIWLQSPTEVVDQEGQVRITYTDTYSLWADLDPMPGQTSILAGHVEAKHAINVITRFAKSLLFAAQQHYRFRYADGTSGRNRFFEILSVVNVDEANRQLNFYCEELETTEG